MTRLHSRVLSGNVAALGADPGRVPGAHGPPRRRRIHLICVLDGVSGWEITMDDVRADLTG